MINKRASWKLPYVDGRFRKQKTARKKIIRLRVRNSVIAAAAVGKTLYIYNGNKYLPVVIKKEMVGHKIGEMSITKALGFKPKKSKKIQKKAK